MQFDSTMNSRKTGRATMGHVRPVLAIGLVSLLSVLTAACGDKGDDGPAEPVCDEFDLEPCDCTFGSGYRYCRDDGMAMGECVCAISEAVVGDHVEQVDGQPHEDLVVSSDGRNLEGPLDGNDYLQSLEVGDIVFCWNPGFAGRVTAVVVDGGTIRVETEECAMTDVFETLEIDIDQELNLMAHLPDEVKEELRAAQEEPPPDGEGGGIMIGGRTDGVRKDGPDSGTESGVAGLDVSISGSFDVGVEVDPATHVVLDPHLYVKGKIGAFRLNHFAAYASIDLDVLLDLTTLIEAGITVTTELDPIEMAVYAATGIDDFVLRFSLGGGFELEFFFVLGAQLELDGHVEIGTYAEAAGLAYGGIAYSRDWDADVWDEAPDPFVAAMPDFGERTWESFGDSTITADAGIDEFTWGAHGGIEFYVTAKIALTWLRCGGPTIDVQPFARFDAWVGDKNKLEASMGVRSHAGGKIELFGEETLWEQDWELFEIKQVIWDYAWMMCGDGIRSTTCYDLADDSWFSSGCDGNPEECDAGLFFLFDGQGHPLAEPDEDPCIAPGPGVEDACTCGPGWAPATGDEWWWVPFSEEDYQWGDKLNYCVKTCGNGTVDLLEGEVCDDGNRLDGDFCSADCSDAECLCGDGIEECWEACDDGNTTSGDGCNAVCTSDETCGNSVVDILAGEQCDDGNADDCDRCSNNCRIVHGCGDGAVCGDEECDDGNYFDCDGCHDNCAVETGMGDGVVCGGEECDDGNILAGDGCDPSGIRETCGDGIIQTGLGEECDDENLDDCDGCTYLCRLHTPVCGDHVVCTAIGEQCDDGDLDDCDGCHNDCTLNVGCGDGHTCGMEACDDGNADPCDGCRNDCTAGDPVCGDGATCGTEECDDANVDDCDACRNDCTLFLFDSCGDGHVCGTEVCDDGNTFNGDGCREDCEGIEVCGDGLLDLPAGEGCEDTSMTGVDLGCTDLTPDCLAPCVGCQARCGDGLQGPGETCEATADEIDPGCTEETPLCNGTCDGCVADCSSNTCGDGVVCDLEECDDANAENCDGCHDDCTLNTGCGDGHECGTEVCDDGNRYGGDGCRADCMGTEICGDGLIDYAAGEACEDTSAVGIDLGCAAGHPNCGLSVDCLGCTPHTCGDGILAPSEACDGETDLPCTDPVLGYAGLMDCNSTCTGYTACLLTEYCGDGTTNGFEGCDDGDDSSCTTSCDSTCTGPVTEPHCGNGVVDCGEFCDDGNATDCVGWCDATCSAIRPGAMCGDGTLDAGCEVCENSDPTDASIDDGCDAVTPHCNSFTCGVCTASVCGNGIIEMGEECDDGGFCPWSEQYCTTLDMSLCTDPRDTCDPEPGDGCSATCLNEW